jgi:hypothetical protein
MKVDCAKVAEIYFRSCFFKTNSCEVKVQFQADTLCILSMQTFYNNCNTLQLKTEDELYQFVTKESKKKNDHSFFN